MTQLVTAEPDLIKLQFPAVCWELQWFNMYYPKPQKILQRYSSLYE